MGHEDSGGYEQIGDDMYRNAEMDYFHSLDNGLNWVCMCNVYLSRLTTGNITVEDYE